MLLMVITTITGDVDSGVTSGALAVASVGDDDDGDDDDDDDDDDRRRRRQTTMMMGSCLLW